MDIQYNTDFTVEVESSAQSWITFVKTKALSSGKLQFSFAANESTDERTGKVTIKDKTGKAAPVTITFTQDAKKVLKVGDSTTIPAEGGTYEVDIQYNTVFTVEVEASAQSWITFIKTKALSSGKLQFIFAANESYDERTGKVTVKDISGKASTVTILFTQAGNIKAQSIRETLMKFYDAMDGPNWKKKNGWGTDARLDQWDGVHYYASSDELFLSFNDVGLKGEIPECFGELTSLRDLHINNELGLTGTLPKSFANLVNLNMIDICNTSMTSLPDVFGEMKHLSWVMFYYNQKMAGPLPESLGLSNELIAFSVTYNLFEGSIPATWARLSDLQGFSLEYNHLSGKIPDSFLDVKGEKLAHRLERVLQQEEGYGFDISDLDIPGYWPLGTITDFDGKTFSFADVVKKNKYTVYLSWATWCPFSSILMPAIKDYYELYKKDGLEIIATVWHPENVNKDDNQGFNEEERLFEKQFIQNKGYDSWYNFYFGPYNGNTRINHLVPVAEVYDSNGYVLFSTQYYLPDPVRKRYGTLEGEYSASSGLIPFLETLLGPAEIPDPYVSTDYSKDGEVLTLQTASVGKGINIVFMGDAYTDRDMGAGGLYETVMKQAMEEFFAIEPYKTFRNRFNVYAVKVVSKNGRIGDGYSTALGVSFGSGTHIGGNTDKCFEYAGKVSGLTDSSNLLISVIVNSKRNAGTTYMFESLQSGIGFSSSCNNDPEVFGGTLRHESGGHAFGFLADEYSDHSGSPAQSHIDEYTVPYEKYGWFSNVDFTNDRSKVRWSAFLNDDRYTGEVGIYEGAALYAKGAWRPSENSMMKDNYEYFNAPSRWAIYKRIMELSGEEASFAKFLEYDAVNRGATKAGVRPPLKRPDDWQPGAPPVIVP